MLIEPAYIKGQPAWDKGQIAHWYNHVVTGGKTRHYTDILARINALPKSTHKVEQYGEVIDGDAYYPLMRVTVGDVHNGKPNILLIGGNHGYEPSAIEATLRFLQQQAPHLAQTCNIVVYPCLSPWAYEHNHRWTKDGHDLNRMFFEGSGVAEAEAFVKSIEELGVRFTLGLDGHETPDLDANVFRTLRALRYGTPRSEDYKYIPQGFYLIMSDLGEEGANQRQLGFGRAIIENVRKISPIAPEAKILGETNHGGIILSGPTKGLLRTYLQDHVDLLAVTEVYPDHPSMTPEKAIQAQIAAIHGAIGHLLKPSPAFPALGL